MTVYAITDTKTGRTGIAPTYLQTTPVVVANTMLMYKMRKLRSHFLSHLYAVMHDACPSLFYLCGLAELEQNSSYAVALPCLTLLRRYLSLRSWLRSCGQVLGTPNPGETSRSEMSWGRNVQGGGETSCYYPRAAVSQWHPILNLILEAH